MKKLHLVSLLTLLQFQFSCRSSNTSSVVKIEEPSAAGSESSVLDLNDVSILMPTYLVPGLREILPKINDKPDPKRFAPGMDFAAEDGEGFVHKGLSQQVLDLHKESRDTLIKASEVDHFRLVAIRIDPCANDIQTLGNDLQCARVLRIVWQRPVLSFDGKPQQDSPTDDSNLHTIYRLSDSEFKNILSTLKQLHQSASVNTRGMPLAPHPVIAKEGVNSPYLKGVLGIIHRYVRASKLIGIADMLSFGGTGKSRSGWSMVQAAVAEKRLIKKPVPALQFDEALFGVQETGPVFIENFFAPPRGSEMSESNTTTFPPPFHIAEAERDFDAEARKLRLKNAYALDNPLLHNALNINCGGCHRTFNAVADKDELEKNGNAQLPLEAYSKQPWNMTNISDRDTGNRVLQMFSYTTFDKVRISQRTINESANVLNYLIKLGWLGRESGNGASSTPVSNLPTNPAIVSGGIYQIISEYSGKCLQVVAASQDNGARLEQSDCGSQNSQRFRLSKNNDDSYSLASLNGGKCLDVKDGVKTPGTAVQQWDCNERDQQKFLPIERASKFSLRSAFAGLCLDVAGPSKNSGAALQVWSCQSSANQTWTLKKIEE
jgi:hypothetical protein